MRSNRAGAMTGRGSRLLSIALFVIAFGADRLHKFLAVSGACIGGGCVDGTPFHQAESAFGWTGGEYVQLTPFFDYVLVWNTGISYGLLTSLPVGALSLLMLAAIVALGAWWWNARQPLVRAGLALALGGAASNALDRVLYGAVADFFHFHYGPHSFYIFNVADSAITLGVILLILDFLPLGRRRNT
jgi:signal peptidase II